MEAKLCVKASVNMLEDAAGIYKIPLLTFPVQSVRISKPYYTELRALLTRPLWPSTLILFCKLFLNLSFWNYLFSAGLKLAQLVFHYAFITVKIWKTVFNILCYNFTAHNCCFRRSVILSVFCSKCFFFRYSNVNHHSQLLHKAFYWLHTTH